jgi:hypothetical protein
MNMPAAATGNDLTMVCSLSGGLSLFRETERRVLYFQRKNSEEGRAVPHQTVLFVINKL